MGPHADQFLVQCTCGRKLRIRLPFSADKRVRCPDCSELLRAKRLISPNPEYRFIRLVAIVFLIVGLVPIVWPAGVYLLAGVALLYSTTCLKLGSEMSGWAGSKRFTRLLCFNSAKGVQEVTLWVSVGILIVCVAQFLLRVFFAFASETRILSIETRLVAIQTFLSNRLTLKWILAGLAIWLVFAVLWPTRLRISQFQTARKWVGRTVTVVTIVASFSFFSARTVASLEPAWVAERRQELSQSINKIRNARQQLVTDAYLQEQIEHLSEASRVSLAVYFSKAANEKPVRDLGAEILKTEPPVSDVGNDYPDPDPPPDRGPAGPRGPAPKSGEPAPKGGLLANDPNLATEESISRVDEWLNGRASVRPSLTDVQRVTVEAQRSDALMEASKSALEESLRTALGMHWQPAMDTFAKQLVRSLQSSVIKTSVSRVLPRGVNSVKAALGWVRKNVRHVGQAKWSWSIGTIDDYWTRQASLAAQKEPVKTASTGPTVAELPSPFEEQARRWPAPSQTSTGQQTVDWLIEHLACPDEDIRLASAETLNSRGPYLKQSDVAKIVGLLDDNRTLYRLSPDRMFFDTAPVRYYAAKAISGMSSNYLNATTRLSAGQIVSEYRTPIYTKLTTTGILKAAGS